MDNAPALRPAALRRRTTYLTARLAAEVRRRCTESLAELGLGQYQHAILCCLDEFGPQIQKEVATRLGIDSGDLVAFVDGLQDAALLERQRDPRDRRRQVLTMTPHGKQVLEEAERLLDQATAEAYQPLAPAERETLHGYMMRILAHGEPGAWPSEANDSGSPEIPPEA